MLTFCMTAEANGQLVDICPKRQFDSEEAIVGYLTDLNLNDFMEMDEEHVQQQVDFGFILRSLISRACNKILHRGRRGTEMIDDGTVILHWFVESEDDNRKRQYHRWN